MFVQPGYGGAIPVDKFRDIWVRNWLLIWHSDRARLLAARYGMCNLPQQNNSIDHLIIIQSCSKRSIHLIGSQSIDSYFFLQTWREIAGRKHGL